jgi:hypothetical protein
MLTEYVLITVCSTQTIDAASSPAAQVDADDGACAWC